jgi:TRAP-type uncharacterized transport system substrate-binding protein
VLVIVVLGLLGALAWMGLTIGNPFPPRTVVMATGPEGSAYAEFGARYQQVLKRAKVDLRLMRTEGGVENLARLRDPRSEVSVAFVEAGVAGRDESPDVVSLGTVTVEPLWAFLRGASQGATVAQKLEGKRISIEPEGSATPILARRLLALNAVPETSVELLALTPEQTAEALLSGEIDGAFMLTSWQSPAVQRLLHADGIVLENYPRADAYVALFPSLVKVVLPTGVVDLARNIPPADVALLAVQASLVVRTDLHPALQYLLLEAASEIHGGPEVFHRAGRFPAPEALDLPLSDQARQFYRSGRPFVYRYLPFWLAGLAERLFILLIPLFAVVFPIAHFLPTIFAAVTERRIFSLYGQLKILERELETRGPGEPTDDVAAGLKELARRANRLRVPLSFAQRLFILKSHIALAQEQVEKR